MSIRHEFVLQQKRIQYNTGEAFRILKGQIIRVVGRTTADLVAFNLENLRERFDQARTKVCHGRIFVTTGDKLFSKSNKPMLSIIDDTLDLGKHDLQFGMCSSSGYARLKGDLYDVYEVKKRFGVERDQIPNHGCWENLSEALEPWGIPPEDIPSPFNVFQESKIDGGSGKMEMVFKALNQSARIDFEAEMDCLVAISACPWVGRGEPVDVTVYERNAAGTARGA